MIATGYGRLLAMWETGTSVLLGMGALGETYVVGRLQFGRAARQLRDLQRARLERLLRGS